QLINIMKETDKPLSELVAEMTIYPQILKNIKLADKKRLISNPLILDEIDQISKKMGDTGGILFRPSGTEELVRVMVEAETEAECEQYAEQMVELITSYLG